MNAIPDDRALIEAKERAERLAEEARDLRLQVDDLELRLARSQRLLDESKGREEDLEREAEDLRDQLTELGRRLANEQRRHRLAALRLADYE